MEKLIMAFQGYSEIDKEDLVVEKIENGKMVPVDTKEMEIDEITQRIDEGELFVNFVKSYENTLDGSITINVETD
jgi:hypothetical protein